MRLTSEHKDFVLRDQHVRRNAVDYINSLDLDKPWRIVVGPHVPKRSLAQNRLYWMWAHAIQQHLLDTAGRHYSDKQIHAWLKEKFLPTEIVEIKGEVKESRKSTADLTVKEMSKYLNDIDMYCAADLDLVLPHPQDLWIEAMGRAA